MTQYSWIGSWMTEKFSLPCLPSYVLTLTFKSMLEAALYVGDKKRGWIAKDGYEWTITTRY
jgi:hypothetical protein